MENSTNDILDQNIEIVDNPWQIAIKYALMATAFVMIMFFLQYLGGFMDFEPLMEEGASTTGRTVMSYLMFFLSTGVYFLIYYQAVKEYRNELGGYITFGKGFKVAYFSVIIKSILVAIFVALFYTFIFSDYGEQTIEYQRFMMEQQGADDQAMEIAESWTKPFVTPFAMSVITCIWTLIGGAILSLIAGFVGQKNAK